MRLPLLFVCLFVSLIAFHPGRTFAQTGPRLEEVVSVASRIDRPLREVGAAVSLISGDELRERGYASVMDALRTQPSVGVSNAGGPGKVSALRIRGEEGYRTLIRIDGIDVSDPSRTQVGASVEHLIATREIDRIEILRGPQGLMYGADGGGVVDIVSRRGTDTVNGHLGLEIGELGTRRLDADVSAGGDRGDVLVSVADLSSDGFNSRVSDANPADDDGYDNTTAHARLGLNAGENVRLELVARSVDARYEFDQCGFPTTHDCVGDTDQDIVRVAAEWNMSSLTHLFAYSGADTDRANFTDGVETFATAGTVRRFEYTGSFEPSPALTLVYGVDLEDERIDPSGSERLERGQDAYYLEYQGRFKDRVYVTAGARRDDNDDFGGHTSARVTVAYVAELANGATLKYRGSAGTGFRAPSLSELAYNRGPFASPPAAGLELTEELSRGHDLGLELVTARGGAYEITYFDQDIEDEIYFDLSGFSGYLQSPGTSASRGIELAARIPAGVRWTFVGNATFARTETSDGLDRLRRPDVMANLGFRYAASDDRLQVRASLRIADEASDEIFGVGRVTLASYEVLDLSLTYAATARIDVFARLENALDETYEEVSGFRAAGSALYGGARVRF